MRATHDSVVVVTTVGSVTGIPVECEQAWLGLRGAHEEVVVSTASVVCIAGLGSMAGSTPAETVARSFASIMRAWCRDRSIVEVRLDSRETSTLAVGTGVEPATMRSVGVLHGRLVAAYADHLDLRLDPEAHADWSDRVLAPVISIPYAGIAVVRRSWEPSPVWAP